MNLAGTVQLPPSPWAVAADPARGAVWVACRYSGSVACVDESMLITGTVTTGHSPCDVAVSDGGRVVAVNHFGSSVVTIDSDEWKPANVTPVGFLPIAVAANGGRAYAAASAAASVAEVDLDVGSVVRHIQVGGDPCDVATGFGVLFARTRDALWITAASGAGEFDRVEMDGPGKMALTATGRLWLTHNYSSSVSLCEPDGSELGSVEVGTGPWGIAAAEGVAYVAMPQQRQVAMIEASTMRVVDTITLDQPAWALTVMDGALYACAPASSELLKISL